MKTIKLTKDKVAIVDDEDYERVNAFKWQFLAASKNGDGYACRDIWIAGGKGKHYSYKLHHFIMNSDNTCVIDHINRDKLDNRKLNLRFATDAQNNYNVGLKSNNKSGYNGVYYDPKSNKWIAQILHKYLGGYNTKEDAALEYNKKAKQLFGEFAYLNTIL